MNVNKARRLVKKPLYRIYESRILKFLDREKLPRHIGVIHDGHRRYARAEGLPDYAASYREGMKKFVEFLGWADELEIHAVTCWLLSTENLSRPQLVGCSIPPRPSSASPVRAHDDNALFISGAELICFGALR